MRIFKFKGYKTYLYDSILDILIIQTVNKIHYIFTFGAEYTVQIDNISTGEARFIVQDESSFEGTIQIHR